MVINVCPSTQPTKAYRFTEKTTKDSGTDSGFFASTDQGFRLETLGEISLELFLAMLRMKQRAKHIELKN